MVEKSTFEMKPGTVNSIRNHQPGPVVFRIKTVGGTALTIRLPPGGEVEILAGTDLFDGSLDILDYVNGPQSV